MDNPNRPEQFIRAAASGKDNAAFVIRDQIVGALNGPPLDAFRIFLQAAPVDKFLILTDYCFHESYPNDVMVYTVVKGSELFPTSDELAALAADLKSVRDLDDGAIRFLRDARLFTFVIVLQKKAKLHATREAMLESMDTSIKFQSTWVNAAMHQKAIDHFKALRRDAESKSFSQILYDRMLLASMIAALLSALILEINPVPIQAVGWFSDRDSIVENGTALASHFYGTILHDYCVEKRVAEPPTVGVIDHSNPALAGKTAWFDSLIRIADYFAGPLARIDYSAVVPGETMKSLSQKDSKLFSRVFADNPNLVVLRLLGKLPPFQTSLVGISNTPSSTS